ncbi:uncharacterized protein KY384_002163 [Bacidia gigantensis]|uniref:uncharacterized protein n=1 Tax=Bacidia gigantensis TaxID=2732470 RepID=UPI001D0368E3|nr:uncharacterized protein KY384_002163 [Bacidia gigantensis]KAG8533380.1 hypothetical protein KY384_002163 [Bacidia gigantensis]
MPPRRIQQEESWNSLHRSEASGDVSNDEFAYSEDVSMPDEEDNSPGAQDYTATGLPSPPTAGDIQRALHPLQTTADRVGKQVEEFAEELDRLSWARSESRKEKGCRHVLPQVQAYQKIAGDTARQLQTLHGPSKRRRLSSQSKRQSQMRDATPTSRRHNTRTEAALDRNLTNVDDLIRWEQEEQTWHLLGSILHVQYPVADSEGAELEGLAPQRPVHNDNLHHLSSEKEVWGNFLATDDLAWERHTVVAWLQRTADHTRPDIEQLVHELETAADRGSGIVAHSWLYTREAIKKQRRLRSWPRAFEPSDPGLTSLLNASKTEPLVTQLDPDAITRQQRSLEKQDLAFERAMWLACWEMLRRGSSWQTIKDWCNDRAEYWRSAAMHGELRLHPSSDADWSSQLLWRKSCAVASMGNRIDDYEKAVYGVFGGYLAGVQQVSHSWDDELFAHYNSYLVNAFELYTKTKFADKIPAHLRENQGIFAVSPFAGQRALSGNQLVEKLRLNEGTKTEARGLHKMLQGSLIAKNFNEFVFKHGVRLCQAANASGKSKILEPMADTLIDGSFTACVTMQDYDMLRLITHIILIYQELGFDFGEGDRRFATESFIVAYVDYLSKAGKLQLLPLYASRLSQDRAVVCLGRQLPSIQADEDRRTMMALMKQYKIDIPRVLYVSTTLMLEDAPDHPVDEFNTFKYPALEILEPAGNSETLLRAIAGGFLSDQVTDDQMDLIHGFEWYMLLEGHWQRTMAIGLMIYKYFLRGKNLAAARQLSQAVPFSHISLTKSVAMLGEVVDICQSPISDDEEDGPLESSSGAGSRKKRAQRREPSETKALNKKVEREVLLRESATFRGMEHLFVALNAMEQWRAHADQVVQTSHQTTGPALKQLIGPFKIAFKHVEDAMQPLLRGWLQEPKTEKEAQELKNIRLACLPETILAYNSILNFSSHFAGREILKTSMDLAVLVAEENSDLAACFKETGRMPELVDSFAVVAKSMIVAESKKPGEKHRDGKSLGLWSAKVRKDIMTDVVADGSSTTGATHAARRQRAPTITINTSPGDQNEERDEPAPLPSESNTPTLKASHSFDAHRPVSPHNVSSPSSKRSDLQPHHFLSVPSTRSRGNSVDSEEGGQSVGGETLDSAFASMAGSSTAHSNNDNIMQDEEALKPDPRNKSDFEVENNKFAFSPGQMNKLLNPKSLAAFHALGGLKGLEKGLRADRNTGLSLEEKDLDGTISFEQAVAAAKDQDPEDFEPVVARRTTTLASKISEDSFIDRKRIFKDNRLPEKKAKSIWQLAWIAYNDKVLILLSVAAVISLALGIYQSVNPTGNEARVQWVEGVAIMVAIAIVVVVGAANDWQKERQFVKLNKKKDDRNIKVVRSGKSREISVHDVLVGDVIHLEPGDMIPVDGIFISGHNLKCDESSATGESDLLRKQAGDEVYTAIEAHHSVSKMDPFIISGAKVSEGIGTFLVTSVGVNSSYGKTMMSLREDSQTTPLQSKLNVLAEYIAKLGLAAGLILFVATFIKFVVAITGKDKHLSPDAKGQQFLQVFIVAVTVIVVAVPEGLPLAVTLALAFATTRMLKDNNLVRLLQACETMGNATTVCSDKTGTLTQNRMSTVAGILGAVLRFGDKRTSDTSASTSPDSPAKGKGSLLEMGGQDRSANDFVSALANDVKLTLRQSISVNSTAFEGEDEGGQTQFIGSKTETALLNFARDYLAMTSVSEDRSEADVVQMIPFDSGRKCMAVVIRINEKCYRMLVKGASEILLARCSRMLSDPTRNLSDANITHDQIQALEDVIEQYASRSLRTIGMVYRDFEHWPPKGVPTQEDDPKLAVFDKVFKDMTFLGVVGIQDPLRDGAADAVRACQHAGVFVRMVTGDNLLTAKAIAQECGIHTPGGLVMEGPTFRRFAPDRKQMYQMVPKLQVLARSSPDDKKLLVEILREMGETVAVTGDGTNDAPALKKADVGFSMGIAGTEVAKEASAIILMDDNFASIVKAIMWGRAVNDSVKKFLQFQITVNITAVLLTFISAVASDSESSVLTAVQLLWVNLIMDTFAALALATDPPTPSILNRPPEPKSAPLITLNMWKMIITQSIFQLVVTLILNFGGKTIFSYQTQREQAQLKTVIFNTFVWMQIFNQYNNRRLDNKLNIFEGITHNYFFIGIQFIIVAGQIMIVFVGGAAFSVHRLNGPQWAYSVILGLLSIPVAVMVRLIPDELIRKCIPSWFAERAKPKLMITDEERQFEWNPGLEKIKEELTFLRMLRGGRLTVLRYKLSHPRDYLLPSSRTGSSHSRSRTNSLPQTPSGELGGSETASQKAPPTPESRRSTTTRRVGRSRSTSAFGPAAAMAGVVAGSIAGWSPIGRREEDNSASFTQTDGRSQLENMEGVEVHPGTSQQDPVVLQHPDQASGPPSQVPEISPAPPSGTFLKPPKSD